MCVETKLDPAMARTVLAGRIDVLYRLGRPYLSLPFAALCVLATRFTSGPPIIIIFIPLCFQMAVVILAERLLEQYRARDKESDPAYWAHRYTFVSALAGASWGLGAWFWFVPSAFPAEAYLTLAFLGMTSTEFIVRAAHRPAYLVHAAFSLTPLVVLLAFQGGLATMSAALVVLFVGVLTAYSDNMAAFLNESIRLRLENADLVVRLRHEKGEAEAARDLAQASARAKERFLANVSHELRTPLNALLGMAQLLDRAQLADPHRDHVKVMLEAGRGLETLLEDVLTLTQDNARGESAAYCDPIQAARAVARLARPRARQKGISLEVLAPPELSGVCADARRVRQVLLKLTDNALKFTERGSIQIKLESSGEADSRRVRFCIIDSGAGVSDEAEAHLFTPFSPGDSSYTRAFQGAGLGLAVAKQIVESLGGSIGFEHNASGGSIFWFTLPVAEHLVTNDQLTPQADLDQYEGALDAEAMAALESSVGVKTLIEILKAYIETSEKLCSALGEASEHANWEEAARVAQDIAGSAGALGLSAITASARMLASAARQGDAAPALRERACEVLREHEHVRKALETLYPALAA